jgi:AmmeMemoRadiSam system protein A
MATKDTFSETESRQLVDIAHRSVAHGVYRGRPLPVDPAEVGEALQISRGSFVTLRARAELRGCIGSLDARRALAVDVADNAYQAAFKDPRFEPVADEELPHIEVEVSVLSAMEVMTAASEAELLTALRPGVDGLLIQGHSFRATFLPAVWAELDTPTAFVEQLKRKAGLGSDDWPADIVCLRYTTLTIR